MSTIDARDFRRRDQLLLPWSPGRSVSTARAAKMLDTSQSTILAMIESGTLKAFKLRPDRPNSPFRVLRESVEAHAAMVRKAYEDPSALTSRP